MTNKTETIDHATVVAPPRPPTVEKMEHRIATLQRRQDYLERLVDGEDDGPRRDYDLAEIAALRGAIECMRYVQRLTAR